MSSAPTARAHGGNTRSQWPWCHRSFRSCVSVEGGNPLDGKHGSVEERVTQFYEVFLPSKLSKLSKILFRYKGKEAQLLEDMRARYGGKTLA